MDAIVSSSSTRSASPPPTPSSAPTWVRIGLVALGLPHVLTGLWAVVASQHWFDTFPGWDPRLVAADPPYNAHLAADAGAGLLAAGFVLVVAAVLGDRRSVRLALAAFLAFAVPHAVYHIVNPAPGLSTAENVQNAAVLAFVVAAAVGLFVGSRRRVERPATAGHSPGSTEPSEATAIR